jgi:Zn-dependent protease with chaperone function
MTSERYQRLVDELEELSRTRPQVLRRRVRLLVAVGYLYVFFILALIVAGVAGLVWLLVHASGKALVVKLGIPLVGLMYVIARSLWVKVDPPEGKVLAPGTAPALDARVEEIRRALDAPRADTVLLTNDFNASVTQVPRLGVLGWPKTYLTLGVPLMLALDRHQLDAVLGHEFAHLSGAHPKLGLWVYRMSRTWDQLLTQLEERRSWGHKLFEPFIRWYAPRTQAYGYVLSRRDEYEADADSARIVSPRAMAQALVATELGGRALSEHVWPQIWRRAAEEPQPPGRCWSALVTTLQGEVPPDKRVAWLGTALARRASDGDTHPSLRERLAALGVEQDDATKWETEREIHPDGSRESAAEHYLGPLAVELLSSLDQEWSEAAAEGWKERHEEVKRQRAQLAALAERESAGETLSTDDLWSRATMLADLREPGAAISALRELVAREPDGAGAQIMLGQLLLDQGDADGVAHVRRAMELTSRYVTPAASILHDYYAEHGMIEDARAMARVRHDHAEEVRLALAERADVTKSDTLVPAVLPASFVERVHVVAQEDERVEEVWVCRKRTSHLPDYPMIVVFVVPARRRSGKAKDDGALARDVLGRIDSDAYVHLLVLVDSSAAAWLRKRIATIDGARVYARDQGARAT